MLYHHFLPLRDENLLGLVAAYTVFFAAFASLLVKLREDIKDSSSLDALLVAMVCAPLFVAIVLTEEGWSSVCSWCCGPNSIARRVRKAIAKEFGRIPHDREATQHSSTQPHVKKLEETM